MASVKEAPVSGPIEIRYDTASARIANMVEQSTQPLPKTTLSFGPRGLPYSREPKEPEDFTDSTGQRRKGIPDCEDACGGKFRFAMLNPTAAERNEYFTLFRPVTNRPDCPAGKFVWDRYFNTHGMVQKGVQFLYYADRQACDAYHANARARTLARLEKLMPKSVQRDVVTGEKVPLETKVDWEETES